jgi:hypothetical protein
MKRTPVTSSNVVSVGYDRHEKILEVEFKGGGLYQYENVPAHIIDDLLETDSVGEYLNKWVKGTYSYARV